jgi:hypothetical protein
MSEEDVARKRWEDWVRKFEPIFTSSGKGIDTDAALRIAHALEYIAAQLSEIHESSQTRALESCPVEVGNPDMPPLAPDSPSVRD